MTLRRSTKLKQVWTLLLCGSVTTMILSGCCLRPKPTPPNDDVIVVEKSQIVSHEDGTYTVNKAWMLKRLETEKKLTEALKMCMEAPQ